AHPADIQLREWLRHRPVQVVSRTEALALGFTDRMIRRRIDSGWWLPLERGLYAISGDLDEWRSVLTVAVTKLPAVVSHHSAAQLHGFPMTPRDKLVVTVPHRTTHTFPGVEICQSTDLTREHTTEVDGLPATTVARTVFDIAHRHRIAFLVALIEKLVVAHQLDVHELTTVLGQLGRRGRPGTVKTRKALASILPVVERLESQLELMVLDLIRDAGLPIPVLQYPLPWRTLKPGRVDMAYPQVRLIIECDGRRWHVAAKAFEDDRRRDNLATTSGWRVVRITWKMAVDEPESVVRMIASALNAPSMA
ncbi:MAG: type IV toxin-antitoxin system AbiEi family antitoxin domain-containing protein, partial [Acidimicrobiia bacterium]